MRNTKIKQSTQQVIQNSKEPISVLEILEQLKNLKISANETTIYRILKSFLIQGIILELDFGEGKKRYEFNNHNHHHHLICKKCSKIEHIKLNDLETVLNNNKKEILQQSNFKITDHNLELFGLCGGCKK